MFLALLLLLSPLSRADCFVEGPVSMMIDWFYAPGMGVGAGYVGSTPTTFIITGRWGAGDIKDEHINLELEPDGEVTGTIAWHPISWNWIGAWIYGYQTCLEKDE